MALPRPIADYTNALALVKSFPAFVQFPGPTDDGVNPGPRVGVYSTGLSIPDDLNLRVQKSISLYLIYGERIVQVLTTRAPVKEWEKERGRAFATDPGEKLFTWQSADGYWTLHIRFNATVTPREYRVSSGTLKRSAVPANIQRAIMCIDGCKGFIADDETVNGKVRILTRMTEVADAERELRDWMEAKQDGKKEARVDEGQ